MSVKFSRVDTSTNFTSANSVYDLGETLWEQDTQRLKVGDGSSNYNSLGYQFEDVSAVEQSYIDERSVDNRVIVKSAADLIDIESTKIYLIDGFIDMGAQQIEVPSGGFYYRGLDYFVSSLFSSEDNYTMFVNKTGEAAGNIRGQNVEHCVSGVGSKIFNLDNQGNFAAAEFISCNFGRFSETTTSLGELESFRQFRTQDCAFIKIADGLTFNGTWSGGLSIKDTILLSIPASTVMFKEGTALSFKGSGVSNINALSVDDTAVIFNFTEANFDIDWGFNLEGGRFNENSNPVPNISVQSTKRYFKSCRGVQNTFIGGSWKLTGESVTVIPAVNTPVKVAGVTTYKNLIHTSGVNSNEFVYESDIATDLILSGGVVFDGGPNDSLSLIVRKWSESTAAYVDVETFKRSVSNVVGGNDVAIINFKVSIELSKGDRIELWVQNNTDASNVTLEEGSFVFLEER